MTPRQQVEALAVALDEDDFETVRSLLASDCVYVLGDERFVGPDPIARSYEAGSQLARSLFDGVAFEHRLEQLDATSFLVRYLDRLRKGAEEHDYWTDQLVIAHPERGIVRIDDRERPEERERLLRFAERVGVELS